MTEPQFDDPLQDPLTAEEKKAMVVGQCNYLLMSLLSLAAFVCGNNAAYTCNFAERHVEFKSDFDITSTCEDLFPDDSFNVQVCQTLLTDHGVGLYNWYGTVPVDTKVCLSYVQFMPNVGWVEPSFDASFKVAEAFALLASIFGALGFFTLLFASCCPINQQRLKGLSCYFSMACICQTFTFFIYNSNICDPGWFGQYIPGDSLNAVENVTCSLGMGARLSIAASVLYLICSTLAPVSIAPTPIGYQRGQQQAAAPVGL